MKKIAIHSVPRSGSSWIGQIFNSSSDVNFKFQPLFSYVFKDYLSAESSKEEINSFFKEIAQSDDAFLLQQEQVDQGKYPKFNKNKIFTHIAYKEVRYHYILENMLKVDSDVLVVGILRNPFAVISSFLKAPKEFKKELGWDELNEWRYAEKKNLDRIEEFNGYEKWKEVARLFQKLKKQYPDRFYLVKYDDLLSNTFEEVENIFNFCGIEMMDQTKNFLKESSNVNHSDAYSVYKKKITDDSWRKSLNPIIIDAVSKDLESNGLKEYYFNKK